MKICRLHTTIDRPSKNTLTFTTMRDFIKA